MSRARDTADNGHFEPSGLTGVVLTGSPLPVDGDILVFDGTNWVQSTPVAGITDHTLLSNIGVNTHVQIDTHIATGSPVHYLQSEISITESQINDFGSYEPANANIQTHIATGSPIHYLQSEISITESQVSDLQSYLLNINSELLGDLSDVVGSPIASADDLLVFDGSDWRYQAPEPIPAGLNTQTGTTYAPVLSDANIMITMNNASANTVTIPANASVAYPINTELHFMQLGAGQTTIAITTDTLNVEATLTLNLTGQYAVATAKKMTSTMWVLFGNLEAA